MPPSSVKPEEGALEEGKPEEGTPEEEKQKDVSSVLPRRVEILKPNPGFPNNKASTGKYTPLNCLPLFCMEQFHPIGNFTNLYYLTIGAMQMIPSISTSYPMSREIGLGFPITWVNVGILLIQETVQRLIEDGAKHRADGRTNRQQVAILRDGQFDENGTWGDVVVGDVVKIMDRESFPADLLLLRSADPMPGQAWVNTKPLDGESDTKLRLAPKQTVDLLKDPDPSKIQSLMNGVIYAEEPNDKVNDFLGQLCIEGQEPFLINAQNMMLRGCQLRSTEWAIGLVVSTGKQTKSDFTAGKPPKAKESTTVKKMKMHVLVILGLILFFSLFGSLVYLILYDPDKNYWYLECGNGGGGRCHRSLLWAQTFGRYILLLYLFIPTTLIVTLPFIQLFQSSFMLTDLEMYDPSVDEPCHVGNPALCDELGQISHIFSDKTGTLTANHMEFRRCVIGGVCYGVGDTAISRTLRGEQPAPKLRPAPPQATCRKCSETFVGFEEAEDSPSLFDLLLAGSEGSKKAIEFFLAMALNHSVTIEEVKGEEELAASSPDEQAFVAASEYFGFEFLTRDIFAGIIRVRQKGTDTVHEVELLEVFPYESSRKRMSVLVRLPPALLEMVGGDCATRLYVKGADSIMLSLLEPGSIGTEPEALEAFEATVSSWAEIALRTLVWAYREVPEYDSWSVEYAKAGSSPDEMAKLKLGEPNLITDLQKQMESSLVLQGASAIEDKLQDGVPEILRDLRAAGIKVWMLTGDKVGTAMNIARACNLLPPEAEIIELTSDTFPVLNQIGAGEMMRVQHEVEQTITRVSPGPKMLARAVKRKVGSAQSKAGHAAKDVGGAAYQVGAKVGGAAGKAVPSAVGDAAGRAKTAVESIPETATNFMKRVSVDGVGGALGPAHNELTKGEAAYESEIERHVRELDEMLPGLYEVRDALESHLGTIATALEEANHGNRRDLCLVLDEKAIEYCGTLCAPLLAAVSNACRSVIACRARKDQKAQMLTMIRQAVPGSCTLAIGDGANDVAMIKAGHIGVGIIGKEGREALNASDFGIGQFRFLRSLLFVHGRNNYRRLSIFIYFTWYKNIVNTLTMFWWSTRAMASGTLLWPSIIADFLAPAAFTVLPILVYPLFDTDVPKEVAARTPELYTAGIARTYYTNIRLLGWVLDAIYAAGICATFASYAFSNAEFDDLSVSSMALATLWLCCIVSYSRLSFEIHSWTIIEFGALFAMIAFLVIMTPIMSLVNGPIPWDENGGFSWFRYLGTAAINLEQVTFWLMLLVAGGAAVLPKLAFNANKVVTYGSDTSWKIHIGEKHNRSKAAREQKNLRKLQRVSHVSRERESAYRESKLSSAAGVEESAAAPSAADETPLSRAPPVQLQRRGTYNFQEVIKRNQGIAQDDKTTKTYWEPFLAPTRRTSRTTNSRPTAARKLSAISGSISGAGASKTGGSSA